MDKYINLSNAISELEKELKNDNQMYNSYAEKAVRDEKYIFAIEKLKEMPACDVAPVRHGRWEFLGPNRLIGDCMCGTCSVCKVRCKYIVNKNICPNCGAKMDLEINENEK